MERKNFCPRILYPVKLSFKIVRGLKVFCDKQKLKEYMTTKLILQKIRKEILRTEGKNKHNHKRMGDINTQEKNRQVIRK
jgi:hypothetical protein